MTGFSPHAFMIAAAYLMGSIPFGLVLTKLAGLGDIRKIGSGNIGATNVLRTGRKDIAALTLFLDGFKGLLAVLIARFCFPGTEQVAGLAALVGHIFPVWLQFKGGKGVVTTMGVLLGLAPAVGGLGILIWTVVVKTTRLSSLAALVAVGCTPILALLLGHKEILVLTFIILALVYYKHTANIERLIKGTEPRVGGEKPGTTDATPPSQ